MSILDSVIAMIDSYWSEAEIREELLEQGVDSDSVDDALEDARYGDHGQ